jgi:hypothetical protein
MRITAANVNYLTLKMKWFSTKNVGPKCVAKREMQHRLSKTKKSGMEQKIS